MGTYWIKSGSFEFDANGDPAEGALAYFFEASTSTPRTVYQDAALSVPHEDPVEADGNGRWPNVFLEFGSFKVTLTTAGGTQLITADNIPNPEPFDESFTLDTTTVLNTGDYIFVGKNGTRTGAVRCNGRTIGSAVSGATERANADTADLYAYLWDNYANGQAAVSTGRGATAAADFAANKTIALPDHRSAHLMGFDDMGNTAAALSASAPVVSGSAILAGSILGANTHTLLTAETPAHTHTFSATTGAGTSHTHSFSATTSSDGAHVHAVTDPGHTHLINQRSGGSTNELGQSLIATGVNVQGLLIAAGSAQSLQANSNTTGISIDSNGAHTHTASGTSGAEASHTHSVSGTTGSIGSGTAHNNLSRAIPVTVLMKL